MKNCALSRIIETVNLVCFILSGIILMSMMLLTVTDVLSRLLLDRPFSSTFELTEIMMMLAVFLGIAYITLKEEHIEVDVLVPRLRPTIQSAIAVFNAFCGACLFAAMSWQIGIRAVQLWQENSETVILHLRDSPFVFVVSMCCFFTLLSFIVLLFRSFSREKG